jgi:hypothetical protein
LLASWRRLVSQRFVLLDPSSRMMMLSATVLLNICVCDVVVVVVVVVVVLGSHQGKLGFAIPRDTIIFDRQVHWNGNK